jgi:DNA-binding response OmpR family regulator
MDVELTEPHDLVIAEIEPAGGVPALTEPRSSFASSGRLPLVEQLASLGGRPIILLADEPTRAEMIHALRLGVRDLLLKPFPVEQLLDAAERVLHEVEVRQQYLARYRKMRGLTRQVIRERRDLKQRIDLICRDLVGAHRRLVHRVIEFEGSRSRPQM